MDNWGWRTHKAQKKGKKETVEEFLKRGGMINTVNYEAVTIIKYTKVKGNPIWTQPPGNFVVPIFGGH